MNSSPSPELQAIHLGCRNIIDVDWFINILWAPSWRTGQLSCSQNNKQNEISIPTLSLPPLFLYIFISRLYGSADVASAAVTSIHWNFQRANIICLNIHNRLSGNCIRLINMVWVRVWFGAGCVGGFWISRDAGADPVPWIFRKAYSINQVAFAAVTVAGGSLSLCHVVVMWFAII